MANGIPITGPFAERPLDYSVKRISPSSPEEIEPYIGTLVGHSYHEGWSTIYFDLPSFADPVNPSIEFDEITNSVRRHDYMTSATIVGESGEIRRGLKQANMGRFIFSAHGVGVESRLYKGRFSISPERASLALLNTSGEQLTTRESIARALFELINPSCPDERVEYQDFYKSENSRQYIAVKKVKDRRLRSNT